MLKIALFTPYLPAPAFSGGRIRIDQFARRLVELGEVHLFARAGANELRDAFGATELSKFTAYRVGRRPLPAWPWSTLPARVLHGSPASLEREFRRAGPFDVAVVEHSHAARWASEAGIPWVLDEHNIESDYWAARTASQPCVRGFEIQRLRRWERDLWRRATEVVCVTREDQAEIARHRGAACEVVANGVSNAAISFRKPSLRNGQEVLFVGLLDHPPNVAAALRLVGEIMPIVWRTVPGAHLVLCGANPAKVVRALASQRVTVTGRVASVEPYLARARAYAFPLQDGAGSSLKVLEALASGVPLVATATAVRGFGLLDGVHFQQADDAIGMALRLIGVLSTGGDDARAVRGRAIAEAFDWGALAQRFVAIVERAHRNDSRPAP